MKTIILYALVIFSFFSCKKNESDEIRYTVFSSTGNIQVKLDEFKAGLGNLNILPGAVGGRREITWESIPDSLLNRTLAPDFFNTPGNNVSPTRQRGLVYSTGEIQVSQNNFTHINAETSGQFSAFSGTRAFANVNSAIWQIGFEVAGSHEAASSGALGLVFSDVDLPQSTSLEFYENNISLGKFYVPPHDATNNFSFFGIKFHNRKITRVQVSHNGKLSDGGKDISEGGANDLIIMDDIIYSEPVKL